MRRAPRPRCMVKEEDVDEVLSRFRREYEASLIPSKFALDTSHATAVEAFEAFHRQAQVYLSDADRRRLEHSA